jgi:cell wall-associated NlpC family hydrolase
MPFLPFGNRRVKPRRALKTPKTATVAKIAPQVAGVLALVVLLLGFAGGDTQANSVGQSPASVSASTVPAEPVAQIATSTSESASYGTKPIPKVAKSSPPVKPKVKQSESFAASMVVSKPEPTKASTPSQRASTAPRKPAQPNKVSTTKKRVVRPVSAPAASGKGLRALAFAKRQLGEPYRYAAVGPSSWDCSGLTLKAWAAAGVRGLPHSAHLQYNKGKRVSRSNLRKGDLVFFFSPISHVGIYAGNGKVIHASRPGKPVAYIKISYMRYAGAVRPG